MSADLQINEKMLKIFRLEKAVMKLPQYEPHIEHGFCKGLYARTMYLPANCLLSGAIHKEENFFLVRKGTLAVTTDTEEILISAGEMFITKAGSKRIGFTFTECVVTTFHANPEELRDGDVIWGNYTIPEPDNILEMIDRELVEAK